MAIILNALTTGVGGLETIADASGEIELQADGNAIANISTSGLTVTGTFNAGSLQVGGSDVLVDTDIGTTVQAYDADTTKNDVANTFTANQTINADLTVDTNTLYVDSTNNRVGIGTTSPNGTLHLNSSTSARINITGGTAAFVRTLDTNGVTDEKQWDLINDGGDVIWRFVNDADNATADIYNVVRSGNTVAHHAWYAGTNTEAMRITSTGNVGIGTSSPSTSAKLDVHGRIRTGSGNSSGDSEIIWVNYASDTPAWAQSVRQDVGGANSDLKILRFNSSGTYQGIAMQIAQDSGNVGIGTTSPATKLQVNGVIRAATANDKGVIGLGESAATTNVTNCGLWRGGANSAVDATTGTVTTGGNFLNIGGYDGIVVTTGAASIGSQTERMRIDSSGNVLVATTNAAENAGPGIKLAYSTTSPTVRVVADSATGGNSGYILYNTNATNNGYRFYVTYAGVVNAVTTTIAGISDQRLKENIRDIDEGLDAVMALKPRKFDWKEGKGANTKNARGFIAQEFEQVFPDLVDEWKEPAPEGEEPYKSVRADLIPTLVKAIQEQQETIQELSAQNQELIARIEALENK